MAIKDKINLTKTVEYFVNEGNKIGYMDTEYGTEFNSEAPHLVADGALHKGRCVYLSDAMKVKECSASNKQTIGVAMFDCEDGEECAIETEGLFKMVAGGTITAPTLVEAGADGKVTACTGTGDVPCGIAFNDASAGDYVYVKFHVAL